MGAFKTKVTLEAMKILDFDIENRPLAYWYDGNTTGEITAIAWAWDPSPENLIHFNTLKPPPMHEESMGIMLKEFKQVYDEADMVTGHYIRVHDLPIINAHMIEFGLESLGPKLVQDTKIDLVRKSQLQSSQLALSAMLDVKAEKPRMDNQRWRDANRLTPTGIENTVKRVTGDVRQHMEMRRALLEHKLLHAPKVWVP